jgi:hypothetical protein
MRSRNHLRARLCQYLYFCASKASTVTEATACRSGCAMPGALQHTSAYVSIRPYVPLQHTSAYASIRQHTSACVRIPAGGRVGAESLGAGEDGGPVV